MSFDNKENRKAFGAKPFDRDRKPFGAGKQGNHSTAPGANGRPGNSRPSGSRPSGQHAAPSRPFGTKPAAPRPFGTKPAAPKPYGKPAETASNHVITIDKSARYIAFMALQDVLKKDTYANMALDARFNTVNMSQADKRLATSITYTTLENLIRIDHILSQFLQDTSSLPENLIDLLRTAVCQMFFMDKLPENAIVDETVKISKYIKLESLSGVVNGVLRNIIRKKDEIVYPSPEEKSKYISIMHSMPEWIVKMLIDEYGEEEAEKICAFRKDKHPITIRFNRNRFTNESFEKQVLSKKVWTWEKGILPDSYYVYGISELSRDNDYLAGNYSVQGESSMISAMAVNPKVGKNVLDCCAAPGGKTAWIAETMLGTGRVYAWDVHDHRVALIRAMQKRLQLDNIRPAVHDALIVKPDLVGTMDAVLLDAPCSGIGVMDDKPDIKLHISKESVDELCALQEKLLDTCCEYVKRGGTFVYSTCSILPCENKKQIKAFLERHPDFKVAKFPDNIPDSLSCQADELGLQLLTSRDNVEGFYIVRMKRER